MDDNLNLSLEIDVLASALAIEHLESKDLLDLLALKFKPILPRNTEVTRELLGLGKIKTITLRFEDYHYRLERSPYGAIVPQVIKIVRGVKIKTTEVSMSQWNLEVARSLAIMAERDAEVRMSLNQLLID